MANLSNEISNGGRMKRKVCRERSCPHPGCNLYGKTGSVNITRHGFMKTKHGRQRRFRCLACGKTFSSNTGTPYYRLQTGRKTFDEVVHLSVEGVSKSAIARLKGLSWNTVARWLERAAAAAERFNDLRLSGYVLMELQADEIRTFTQGKDRPTWIFASLEVWSRLWTSTIVGRCSYANTKRLLNDVASRCTFAEPPLITTDGFNYYARVIRQIFGYGCVYGVVMKTRRKDRVVKVDRYRVIGSRWQLEEALIRSEDSSKLNTSFIERLNLTIRQGSAYLYRRSACHARVAGNLKHHLDLFQCYYNFVRPHRALRFGQEMRTPAMQAGLVTKQLSFREIITAVEVVRFLVAVVLLVTVKRRSLGNRSCLEA
jgi:transposase-like protein/IS1 family transposase